MNVWIDIARKVYHERNTSESGLLLRNAKEHDSSPATYRAKTLTRDIWLMMRAVETSRHTKP